MRIFSRTIVLCCAVCYIFLQPLIAANITVNCSTDSLNTALAALDPTGPNVVTVSGVCRENVEVLGLERLTLQAPEGAAATIAAHAGIGLRIDGSSGVELLRLTVSGSHQPVRIERNSSVRMTDCTIENSLADGIRVLSGSHLTMQSSTVRGIGHRGVNVVGGSLSIEGNVRLQSNFIGFRLSGSQATLIGPSKDRVNLIADNTAAGGVINYASSLTVAGENSILNNGPTGFQIAFGSGALFIGGEDESGSPLLPRIEGHSERGMSFYGGYAFLAGPMEIRGNGSHGAESQAGLYFSAGSSALIFGIQVRDNLAPGILAEPTGTVDLRESLVTGNAGGGVRLLRMSIGKFGPGNDVSGNGEADLFCDSTSLAAGDLAGVETIRCPRIERELGPPRPGRIH